MVSGVRADVAVMLYGDDLDVLVDKANQIAKVATTIQGTQDTRIDRVGGQQYLTISIDRGAIARYGLNTANVNDVIETAIAGKSATEIASAASPASSVSRNPCATQSKISASCSSAPPTARVFRLKTLHPSRSSKVPH